MYPPVMQLETQRRELARTLGLTDDPWAAPAAPEREPRRRARRRRRAGAQPRLGSPVYDEC